jgi:hypothetical protein
MVNIDNGKVNVSKLTNPGQADKYFRVDRMSIFGNPFPAINERDRNGACDLYEEYFHKKVTEDYIFRNTLYSIIGHVREGLNVNLMCHCAPKRCHAETIKRYIEGKL